MREVKIIPFEERYTADVVDLILSIQRGEFGIDLTVEDQPDLLKIKEEYMETGGNFWIALSEDKVVGTIALVKLENHCGAIKKMFAAPAFRSDKRVGKALLDTLLAHCRAEGYQKIYLGTVDRLKAAQRFYAKNGFVRCEKADMPQDYHLMDVDDVFFVKDLNA